MYIWHSTKESRRVHSINNVVRSQAHPHQWKSLPAQSICLIDPGTESVARCVIAFQAHHALRNTHSCEINSAVLYSEFTHIAMISCDVLSHFSEASGLTQIDRMLMYFASGEKYVHVYLYLPTPFENIFVLWPSGMLFFVRIGLCAFKTSSWFLWEEETCWDAMSFISYSW